MFSIPAINVISSDEGFGVEILGHTRIRYFDGVAETHFSMEYATGISGLVIFARQNEIVGPPESSRIGQALNDAEREKAVKNIRDAFQFTGWEIDVF